MWSFTFILVFYLFTISKSFDPYFSIKSNEDLSDLKKAIETRAKVWDRNLLSDQYGNMGALANHFIDNSLADETYTGEHRFVLRLLSENALARFYTVGYIIEDEFKVPYDLHLAVDKYAADYLESVKNYSTNLKKLKAKTRIDEENRALDLLDYGDSLVFHNQRLMLQQLYAKYHPLVHKNVLVNITRYINDSNVIYRKKNLMKLCSQLKICRHWPSFSQQALSCLQLISQLPDDQFNTFIIETGKILIAPPFSFVMLIGDITFDINDHIHKIYENERDMKAMISELQTEIQRRYKFVEDGSDKNMIVALRVLLDMIDIVFVERNDAWVHAYWADISHAVDNWKDKDAQFHVHEILETRIKQFVQVVSNVWDKNIMKEVQCLIGVLLGQPLNPNCEYLLNRGTKFLKSTFFQLNLI